MVWSLNLDIISLMLACVTHISLSMGGHAVGSDIEGGNELSVGEGDISWQNRSRPVGPKVKCSNMV